MTFEKPKDVKKSLNRLLGFLTPYKLSLVVVVILVILSTLANLAGPYLGGRAIDTFRPLLRTKVLEHILRENTAGCGRELTDTSHFHLDLFGGYIPGLCSGLTIERDDLGNGLSPDKYPILSILGVKGIRGLFDFAVREYGFRPQQAGYINQCDLCTEIRFFLVKAGYDRSKELEPEEFYLRK